MEHRVCALVVVVTLQGCGQNGETSCLDRRSCMFPARVAGRQLQDGRRWCRWRWWRQDGSTREPASKECGVEDRTTVEPEHLGPGRFRQTLCSTYPLRSRPTLLSRNSKAHFRLVVDLPWACFRLADGPLLTKDFWQIETCFWLIRLKEWMKP